MTTLPKIKDRAATTVNRAQINGISGGYSLPTLITSLCQVFLTFPRQNIYLQFQYLLSYKLTPLRFQINTRRPIKGFCLSKDSLIVNVHQISKCFPKVMKSFTGGVIFQKTTRSFNYNAPPV